MQLDNNQILDDFNATLTRIDYLCHLKLFKSFMESRRTHIDVFSQQKKKKPSDFYLQIRKLLIHMIYLYYVAYLKKINIYVYKPYCINRWGVIFKYYSLDSSAAKFMEQIKYQNFKQNLRQIFAEIWAIKTKEEQIQEEIENNRQHTESQSNKSTKVQKNPWVDFADQFVSIYWDKELLQKITPKEILTKLQQTKHVKNNVLIIGVLTSTIFPCIKFNKIVEKVYYEICRDQTYIIKQIFGDKLVDQGRRQFTNSIIRFFRVLNDFKVLGITTTSCERMNPKKQEEESLLTEFRLSLGRVTADKQESEKIAQQNTHSNSNQAQSSHNNSENDYNGENEGRDLGQLKCQYFWSKRNDPKELTFRVSICINKKICPLYFREIEDIWMKLSQKWKVILDETKQLSGFNPGFVMLSYNKEFNQLSFTEYVKCQPIQSAISQLIITTDKLIIATLIMRDVICFYEKKSSSVEIMKDELLLNDGRYDDMARSICQCVKNYYGCCKEVMLKMQKERM